MSTNRDATIPQKNFFLVYKYLNVLDNVRCERARSWGPFNDDLLLHLIWVPLSAGSLSQCFWMPVSNRRIILIMSRQHRNTHRPSLILAFHRQDTTNVDQRVSQFASQKCLWVGSPNDSLSDAPSTSVSLPMFPPTQRWVTRFCHLSSPESTTPRTEQPSTVLPNKKKARNRKSSLEEDFKLNSTPHALLGFASSGNHTLPCLCFFLFSACRPDHGPLRQLVLLVLASFFCISSFFVSSRSVCDKLLLRHNVLASMSPFVSTLSLRVRLLRFILTSRPHQGRRQQRPRFLCRACCRSAPAALCICFSVHPMHHAASAA